MIEKPSADIQFILHDHPHPPRMLVVSKRGLRRFLVFVPLSVCTLLLLLVGYLLWRPLAEAPITVKLPPVTELTRPSESTSELEAEIRSLKLAQENMQLKLSQTSVNESELWLGPVKKPYALQDLTSKNILKLETVTLDDGAGKRVLRFHLINTGAPTERVSGHIFVFQLDSRGLAPYPAMTQKEWSEGIRYNKGESFSVSRLRPVEAPFPPGDADATFLVFVFNREGDLLLRQELKSPKGASL